VEGKDFDGCGTKIKFKMYLLLKEADIAVVTTFRKTAGE